MFKVYLIIALVISGLIGTITITTKLLIDAKAELAAEQLARKADQQIVKNTISQMQKSINLQKAQRQKDQQRITELGNDLSKIEREKDEIQSKWTAWRGKLEKRTLSNPAVTERFIRRAERVRMCKQWAEHPGNSYDDCPNKTIVRPASKSAPSSPTDGPYRNYPQGSEETSP